MRKKKDLNITRLECKGIQQVIGVIGKGNLNITRLECKDNSEGILIVF